MFSPALSTLQRALKLNYVSHFPGLSDATLANYPPQSVAMIKGHLDQSRKNAHTTKPSDPTPQDDPSDPTLITELEKTFPVSDLLDGTRSHFCFVATTEHTGKIFTDQTGRFDLPSTSTGNTQLLIMYC
jgi:hypothetical protein